MRLTLPGSSHYAPLVHLKKVTHIGTLNPSDKGMRGESYEGQGVSFSLHPDAWVAIARLGGTPWWEVDLTSCQILDGHQALDHARDGLAQWGVEQGLITPCAEFAVSWEDEEWGERVEMVFPSRQEALEEVQDRGEEFNLQERSGWAPTALLLESMGHAPDRAGQPCSDALACTLTVWAQRHGLDGVWWEDTFAPEQLSAPRGVIFKEKVGDLDFVKVHEPSRRSRAVPF